MANLGVCRMTALHMYWLYPKPASAPTAAPIWAWPCSPTITGTQGLSLTPFTFGARMLGGHLGGIYSGSSTGEPCDHTFVATIDAANTNPLVQINSVPLGNTWTLECYIGWSSYLVPTSMDFFRLAVSPDPRVRYTPGTSTLELRIDGAAVVSATLYLVVDTFHHIALTHSNGEYKVYVNGVLRLTYTGTPKTAAANLTLGTVFGSDVGSKRPTYFRGVRLWDIVAYTANFTPPPSLVIP